MKLTSMIVIGALGIFSAVTNCKAQSNLITGPETLFIDTISNTSSSQALPSWILWDTGTGAGFTQGASCGAEIAISAPLLVTKAEFLVLITNASDIQNTEFQIAIFRNTNDFIWSMEEEPLFYTELTANSPELTMESLGDSEWLISVTNISPFILGTNRVISFRAVPIDLTQPFCKLQWETKSTEAPCVKGYTVGQDGTFTIQTTAPAMRLWTKSVGPVGINIQQLDPFSMQLSFVPGVLLGQSLTDAAGPWEWQSTDRSGLFFFDISQSSQGFFKVVPDNADQWMSIANGESDLSDAGNLTGDLNSFNGALINNEKTSEAVLKPSQAIQRNPQSDASILAIMPPPPPKKQTNPQ